MDSVRLESAIRDALARRKAQSLEDRTAVYEAARSAARNHARAGSTLLPALENAIKNVEDSLARPAPPSSPSEAHIPDSKRTLIFSIVGAALLVGCSIAAYFLLFSPGYTEQRLTDLTIVRDALERYRLAHNEYPKSKGWDGLHTRWGEDTEIWVKGLAPEFLPELPLDPERDTANPPQYLYRSNGVDYKLLAHQQRDCDTVRRTNPEMVDAVRDRDGRCSAYGYWTAAASRW